MKIAILGKPSATKHWVEDVAGAFRADGHTVRVLATRNPWFNKSIERLLLSDRLRAPLAAWIVRGIRHFAPDLVLAVGAHECPPAILEAIHAMPHRPPLIGWIGDRFELGMVGPLANCDVVAYTDTGLLAQHREIGIRTRSEFVPHAAPPQWPNGQVATTPVDAAAKLPLLAFVASMTENRLQVVKQIRAPIALYGPDWRDAAEVAHHQRHLHRVSTAELTAIYASHMAVLNIKHGIAVLNGLNQRSFAPYVVGTPVLSDPQPDLELCFEPGREVLVYNDIAQLNEIYDTLRCDPARAAAIGRNGQLRVQAHHMYANRLETFRSFI